MKCVGINNGNRKSDNTPYCWVYYTKENPYVVGLETGSECFMYKHIDNLNVGDEFEFKFGKGNDGKYYPKDVIVL